MAPLGVIKPADNHGLKWQYNRLRGQLAMLQPSLILTNLTHQPLLKEFDQQYKYISINSYALKMHKLIAFTTFIV